MREFADLDSLWEYAPEGVEQSDVSALTDGDRYAAFWNKVLSFLSQALSLGIADGVKLLARLCGILLLGAVFQALEDPRGNDALHTAFQFLFLLSMTAILWRALENTLSLVRDTMDNVCAFLLASLPVSGVLLAMNGEVERATLQGVSLQHIIGVFSVITTQVLGPMLRFLLALTIACGFSGDTVANVSAYLAKFLKRAFLFLFTLLSAILALQNALAAAADSVAMRGVRFAAGSFIPVVGNAVGEASRTIAAGIDLIRKECGVACVIILAYLLARPIVILLTQRTVLGAAGAVSNLLGVKSGVTLFNGFGGVWDLLLAVTAFQGCYCIFSIMLFLGGGNT